MRKQNKALVRKDHSSVLRPHAFILPCQTSAVPADVEITTCLMCNEQRAYISCSLQVKERSAPAWEVINYSKVRDITTEEPYLLPVPLYGTINIFLPLQLSTYLGKCSFFPSITVSRAGVSYEAVYMYRGSRQ